MSRTPSTAASSSRRRYRCCRSWRGTFGEIQFDGKTTSAQKVLSDWPTPIVVSGSEIGAQMLFPATSFEHDFTYTAPHPIAETYRTFSAEETFAIGPSHVDLRFGWRIETDESWAFKVIVPGHGFYPRGEAHAKRPTRELGLRPVFRILAYLDRLLANRCEIPATVAPDIQFPPKTSFLRPL
jgi:hypothetical protein